MNADSHLLAVGEVASLLRVHGSTVRRWIDSGELPAVHIGRTIRIDPEDISPRTLSTSARGPHPVTGRIRDAA